MLAGVILAAGDSTRMGSPKALLLTPRGTTFVVSIARTFAEAGIDRIFVVTGRDHDRVAAAVSTVQLAAPLTIVRNPDPSRGQLSSLLTAMNVAITPETEALVVTLVDVPLLTAETVRRVVAEWRRTHSAVARPAIGERHGHPVVFDRRMFEELREAPLEAGAKAVIRAHAAEVLNVSVTDEGCLVDVDTPRDYEALARDPTARP
jgi:molybdenum cofactor cytidylyltransferase